MNQRGNILFLILLAVVLFAALSYAVTSSMRGGGKNASDESIRAGAAAVSQYVALLRNEVQRLMLVNDCKVENLDWRHDSFKRYNGSYTYILYAGAPPSPKAGCAIFQAYGGPVAPQTFEKYKDAGYEFAGSTTTALPVAGHAFTRWVNRKNEGTGANDVAILFNGLNKELCRYLLNPDTKPSISTDPFLATVDSNSPSPAAYGAANELIDESVNLVGDFFARLETAGSVSYCQLGAILIPQ